MLSPRTQNTAALLVMTGLLTMSTVMLHQAGATTAMTWNIPGPLPFAPAGAVPSPAAPMVSLPQGQGGGNQAVQVLSWPWWVPANPNPPPLQNTRPLQLSIFIQGPNRPLPLLPGIIQGPNRPLPLLPGIIQGPNRPPPAQFPAAPAQPPGAPAQPQGPAPVVQPSLNWFWVFLRGSPGAGQGFNVFFPYPKCVKNPICTSVNVVTGFNTEPMSTYCPVGATVNPPYNPASSSVFAKVAGRRLVGVPDGGYPSDPNNAERPACPPYITKGAGTWAPGNRCDPIPDRVACIPNPYVPCPRRVYYGARPTDPNKGIGEDGFFRQPALLQELINWAQDPDCNNP